MLQTILLVANILVCIALIAVVLMQRSEGGALGMGGGPSGFMTARGAGDLLTRTTWILFSIFLVLSMALTLLGGGGRSVVRGGVQAIDPSKLNQPPAATAPATQGVLGAPTGPAQPGGAPATGAPITGAPLGQPVPGQLGAPTTPPAAGSPTVNFQGFGPSPQQQQAAQQAAAQQQAAQQAAQQQAQRAAAAAQGRPVRAPAQVEVPALIPAPAETPAPAPEASTPAAPATNP